ncbi:MAG: phosphate signaling complex protein PhoU [Phycisphaerales bacterium]|nr:phosphate signaling complex protein PhoU [Phycisphaerales bacterium]
MTAHFVSQLDDLMRMSLRMAAEVEEMVERACDAIYTADEAFARAVVAKDGEIDRQEVEVEAEAIRLMALYQPVGVDLRQLCAVLKVNNDLERIADCAVNIAERSRHLEVQQLAAQDPQIRAMCPIVRRILRNAVQSYASGDANIASDVLKEDAAIDAVYGQIVRGVVAQARESEYPISAHLDLLSVAKNLERIADHAVNIAEDVIYLETGTIVRHKPRA